MTPVSGDFSRGRVSLIILRLGLPMMLAESVHVLYNDGSCDLEKNEDQRPGGNEE